MNKLFLVSSLLVGLSIAANAVQTVPLSSKGDMLNERFAGASACEITSSTGTTALLCTTGSGIILQVFGSSVATTDMLVFRDSNTANTSSTVLLAIDQKSLLNPSNIYPRFNNGLSINALVAPTASGNARPNWTVIYNKDLK